MFRYACAFFRATVLVLLSGLLFWILPKAPPAFAQAEEAPGVKSDAGSRHDEGSDDVKLYQLLYDYHFNEPLNTLGQKVRILIWLRYLDFSNAQKQLLLNLARKFDRRQKQVVEEREKIIRNYEARLVPIYREIYDVLITDPTNERRLGELARELQSANLAHKREDEVHSLRIRMVRAILSEERDFLHTLSPIQEEKLVTSLFFLRKEIDPFAQPGDYRSIVGPTWNAGDFSSLLRQKNRKESQLNIGGLWGIDLDSTDKFDYANVQRNVILFFVLKEPALIQTLEEELARS